MPIKGISLGKIVNRPAIAGTKKQLLALPPKSDNYTVPQSYVDSLTKRLEDMKSRHKYSCLSQFEKTVLGRNIKALEKTIEDLKTKVAK